MRLSKTEHLENRKMHTQERQFTRFFVFYNWSTKKTKPTVLFKTELKPKPNRTRGFSQNRTETEPNLKNPFRTSLADTRLIEPRDLYMAPNDILYAEVFVKKLVTHSVVIFI